MPFKKTEIIFVVDCQWNIYIFKRKIFETDGFDSFGSFGDNIQETGDGRVKRDIFKQEILNYRIVFSTLIFTGISDERSIISLR